MKLADLEPNHFYKLANYGAGGIVRFRGSEQRHVGYRHTGRTRAVAIVEGVTGTLRDEQLQSISRPATDAEVESFFERRAEHMTRQAELGRVRQLDAATFADDEARLYLAVQDARLAVEAAKDALRDAERAYDPYLSRKRDEEREARRAERQSTKEGS